MEGRRMDDVQRPWHKLTWSKAPDELKMEENMAGVSIPPNTCCLYFEILATYFYTCT